ncbi:MAG: trehalase family glycosidase [Puniceicoccaceae bacterium]
MTNGKTTDPATMLHQLTNLIPCDDWETPFVDTFSQFSVGFHQKNLGPAFLHPRAAIATYEIAMPLLHLWIRQDGQWQIVRRQSMGSLPWHQQEETAIVIGNQPVRIMSDYVFADARRLVARMMLTNRGSKPVSIDPAWVGCLRDRQQPTEIMKAFSGARHGPRRVILKAVGNALEAGLEPDPATSDLPHVAYRILPPEGLSASLREGPVWGGVSVDPRSRFYTFTPETDIHLEPGSPRELTFHIDYRGAAVGQPLDPWDPPEPGNFAELLRKAEDRYREAVQSNDFDPNMPPGQLNRLRARTALLRTGVRGHNGEFGDRVASLCSAGTQDFSSSFFWDTLFTSTALSQFNPGFARDAISTAFTRQHPRDGSTPERKWNYSCPQYTIIGCPQSAIGAWALNHYLRSNRDETDLAFAAETYPLLKANHLFWRDYSDADGDGLSEYNWSGQIGDDSQLWDSVAIGKDPYSGCFWLPPIASATCNSFLYRDARELARIAGTIGQDSEVEFWNERTAFIASRMREILWVEEDQRYWDYNHRARCHNKVDTFFAFLPLWADVPMPEAAKRDLIENHLLNPDKFFGPIPFPSVAYDHPSYDPAGYWRGRAWSHFSCWLVETLWREGYCSEADEAARRIIAWQEMWDFRENMNTDPAELFPKGFPHYNWGCAAYCFLAERAYRDPTHPS